MNTREHLKELQSYPLAIKEYLTEDRIRDLLRHVGYDTDAFYVSFSGGKDSEVAVDFVAKTLKKFGCKRMNVLQIHASLEYTSVQQFPPEFCKYVAEKYDIEVNLEVTYPKKNFKQVLTEYGYPIFSKPVSQVVEEAKIGIERADGTYKRSRDKISGTLTDDNGNVSPYNCEKYAFLLDAPFNVSKHCCGEMKVKPAISYEKRDAGEDNRIPIIATLATESRERETKWLRFGCNAFESKRPTSTPFAFWTENDILEYISTNSLPIAPAYGKVVRKHEIEGQLSMADLFDSFEETDEYTTTLCSRTGCIFCLFGIQYETDRILRMQELEPKRSDYVLRGGQFNEEGKWVPSDEGLGYWFILDWLKLHGGIDVPYKDHGYRQFDVA